MAEKDVVDLVMGSSGREKNTESFSKDLMVTMTTIKADPESAVQQEDDTSSPPRSSPSPTEANQSEPMLSSAKEEGGNVSIVLHYGATGSGVTGAAISSQCYLVRWITWKDKKTPIITQSQNGACPLLAIINTLLLRWKATLPAQTEMVTSEELMAHLGECVLSVTPRENTEGMKLNLQQNISDVMSVLPKLSTGLDVNVRFTGVTDFEYTPECIVFDLLDIPLYHGWLVDPQSREVAAAVGKLSYNQLVEKIINDKLCADSSRVTEGLVAEHFLESTATQLSYHGLCELNSTASEGEISVFFRNNHFSTMIKHKGQLYLLVTDQGFLHEDGFVWESLHNVEGDGNFCDSNFRLQAPPPIQRSTNQHQEETQRAQSDLELARQLQQEEYQQPATQQVRGQRSQLVRRRDSDCVLL